MNRLLRVAFALMNTTDTHEVKGQTYTITVEPPMTHMNPFPENYDAQFTVKAINNSNSDLIFRGVISVLFAPYFEKSYKTTIAEFLINNAKAILDARFK